jgi:hypothetical protein
MNGCHLVPILLLCPIAIGCDRDTSNTPNVTPIGDLETSKPLPTGTKNMAESDYEVADIYTDLRNQVLHLQADAIGLNEADQSTVIAVLMETGFPEAVATLVGTANGSASLYFSNGGGIIGGGEHEVVRKVCVDFISTAQHYVSRSALTDTFPLPKEDYVRCYLVTPGGIYSFEALEDDLGNERHLCSELFLKGHELITAIREYTPE